MSKKPLGLLYDMVLCSGCRRCIGACMKKQGFDGNPEDVTQLSATAYTAMTVQDDYPVRNLCRHCVNPSCASVCPVGALEKTELGPVVYDASKCMGCRYCITACPFNIPRYEWSEPVPAVRKCDMCFDRLARGEKTACAEACPEGATIMGPRDELIAEAHRRIKADPDEYYPHVFGENELGGTSVLFLVPFPVASLGFKEGLGTEPLPQLTWEILSKIPGFAAMGGAALMGIWWITRRRNEVALAEGRYEPRAGKENGNG